MRGLAVVIALGCACSPYGGGSFACETNQECGAGGTCSDGFCSFADPDCPSGLRYGDRSGPLSGECVGGTSGDGGVDTPMGDNCFGSGLVVACFTAAPTGTQTFSTNTLINTDTSPLCSTTTMSNAWCVVAAQTIQINNGVIVAATGNRPLVLVATGAITVSGTLDVASHRGINTGPAADAAGCAAGTPSTGTSGGAGGSFGGVGGNTTGYGGGTGATAGAALAVTALRGGCSGQPGADDFEPKSPGTRGRGGGAVQLIANTSITVSGMVNASGSGAGGGGTFASAGGGGGGSGGFIGFDAPTVMITGSAFANGGGGGEASGAQTSGDNGDDPASAGTPAAGGSGGSTFGSDGGAGAAAAMQNGANGGNVCGTGCTTPTSGGGGGGGAGIIKLYRASSIGGGGPVSPAAS